ncbi:MAG: PKD domain-containing protein [ANME-2 cluster archaeon]|nr:PKD domain-containing protein [ANME-2 cluster archaeon]
MSYQINRWLLALGVIITAIVSIIGVAQAETPIKYGETISGSIDPSTEIDTYTFSADSNDTVIIRVDGPQYSSNLNPEIRLYAPNGPLLTSQWSYDNFEMLHTLPDSGKYKILVLDHDIEYTGDYNLFIQRLNNPGNTTPIGFDETVSGSIDPPLEIDTYTFSADSNDTVIIRVDGPQYSSNLNPEIRLYAPNGTLLTSQWSYDNFEMLHTLPDSGEYKILVLDHDIEYTGDYNLFIHRLNNPGLAPFANFTYSPKNPVINQVIIFNATASYDPDGFITNYKWDFGDGNITSTTEKIITHSYTLESDYDVNLTITDNSNTTNSTTKSVQVVPKDITIDLYTGWNLISLPLMPEETNIAFVLSPISDNYSIIWEYNASDTADHWKKYDPGVPFGNDLINMEPGKGYWIMMTSDDTLPISGTIPESTDIDLRTGWNLVGFNSPDSKPIAEALSSINGNYSIVWAYNASDTTDHWKKYDPDVPFRNDLINMEPGRGYWIMMISEGILKI